MNRFDWLVFILLVSMTTSCGRVDAEDCTTKVGVDPACQCNAGYDGNGTECVDIDECAGVSCGDGGSCTHATGETIAGDYTCVCASGYEGGGIKNPCQDIDECMTDNGGCDGNALCTNKVGADPACACTAGYDGNGTECVDIDECAGVSCGTGGNCTHAIGETTTGDYTCTCASGYEGGGIKNPCQDIDECATDNGGCDGNDLCTNIAGADPTCVCNQGSSDSNRSCGDIIKQLDIYLADPVTTRAGFETFIYASTPLSKEIAAIVKTRLWMDYADWVTSTFGNEHPLHSEVTLGNYTMPYACFKHGQKPNGGWSLFLSLHGGGSTTAAENDEQWDNQKHLYDSTNTIVEGIYCAPRAPTNTWDMWHRAHIDAMLATLTTRLIVLEGINPNRVYLMGYSAGGDGLYRLGPRMADHWAAAAMSAGHPGSEEPYGLRNIGFAIHVGANDTDYDRHSWAATWRDLLKTLQDSDPDGDRTYRHQVGIHAEVGHWMDLEDKVAITFMRTFTRNPWPNQVNWHQSAVTHQRFYWLKNQSPSPGVRVTGTYRDGEFTIENPAGSTLSLLLSDEMLDLDTPIKVVSHEGLTLFNDVVSRTASVLYETIWDQGDLKTAASVEIHLMGGGD